MPWGRRHRVSEYKVLRGWGRGTVAPGNREGCDMKIGALRGEALLKLPEGWAPKPPFLLLYIWIRDPCICRTGPPIPG